MACKKLLISDRHRPRTGGNTPTQKATLLQGGSNQSPDQLFKPFKCPGSAIHTRASNKPARKRRKVDYSGADGTGDDGNKPWTNEERLALANRDANKYPVFRVKDKETTFKQRFSIPLINKSSESYDPSRPAPVLGMRRGASFVVKPLHDPSGEFSIVLYDPTIDEKSEPKEKDEKDPEEDKLKFDEPLVHKSLSDILGIKKQVETRPKVPVVIDPRLAKVLRPHQVEGVKVSCSRALLPYFLWPIVLKVISSSTGAQLAWSNPGQMDVLWQMRWVWGKLYGTAKYKLFFYLFLEYCANSNSFNVSP